MKMRNIYLGLGLLFFVAMIASCAESGEKTTYPATPARSTAGITTPKIIALTLTPIVTDTLTPATTLPAIPTLSAESAGERLLDLLSNNGGCRLPCLWGITPGKSTYQEAQILWSPLSGISSHILALPPYFTLDEGAVRPAYVEGDLMLNTEARYQSNDQIVGHISFSAREQQKFVPSTGGQGLLSIFDSTDFGKRIEYYSLAHLLSEQGVPGSVILMTSGPPIYATVGGFEIVVSYPEQGIWVRYTTQVQLLSNGKMRGCPANAHIEMDLYPAGNADFFSTSIQQIHPDLFAGYYQPLEQAASMTLEQFHETFRQPTDSCIDTPAKLWPTP